MSIGYHQRPYTRIFLIVYFSLSLMASFFLIRDVMLSYVMLLYTYIAPKSEMSLRGALLGILAVCFRITVSFKYIEIYRICKVGRTAGTNME